MSNFKPGDKFTVTIGGEPFETYIDENGTQRFYESTLIRHLRDTGVIDLNRLAMDYFAGKFNQMDYLRFNTSLGYSVCGLSELSFFADLEFKNPIWSDEDHAYIAEWQEGLRDLHGMEDD